MSTSTIEDLMECCPYVDCNCIPEKGIFLNFFERNKHLLCKDIDIFVEAIIKNDKDIFNYFMDKKININEVCTKNDYKPIMYAVQYGRFEMMKKLLERGAQIEKDGCSDSALYFALKDPKCGNDERIECAKLLIKAGANIESILNYKNSYIIAKILKNEIDTNSKNGTGKELKIITNKNEVKQQDITNTEKKESETYTTTDGDIINIPPEIIKKPRIKMVYQTVEPIYVIDTILCPSESVMMIINDNGTWKLDAVILGDYDIEIPTETKIKYHYLPVGVILNGNSTTKSYPCKFLGNFMLKKRGKIDSNEIYVQ